MKKILIFSLVLLALSGSFAPVFAQDADAPESNTYDPQYQGWENPAAKQIRDAQRANLVDKGFIKPSEVQVAIVHHDYMEEKQFGIQMSVPDVVSGCFTLTPLEYEAKFTQPYYLDIKVKQYRRVAPEGAAATKKCSAQQNQMSTALMVLSKKDLEGKGTQIIRFSTEAGTDHYQLILSDDRVELLPRTTMVFKPQNLAGPLKDRIVYPFSSRKMVTLQVPMAQPGEDLSREIMMFATSRALTPADKAAPTSWGVNGMATYYFYDDGGHVIDRIGPDGYAELGKIAVNRPYDGPEGRRATPVTLSVFATRPGTQL